MNAAAQALPSPCIASGRWLESLSHWPRAALKLLRDEPVIVRVLMLSLRGSAPREAGACMLVGRDQLLGTIGGGTLEFEAHRAALALLNDPTAPSVRLRKLVLGTELGQCCGGVVELWLEKLTAADMPMLREVLNGDCYWNVVLNANNTVTRQLKNPLSPRERGRGEGHTTPQALLSDSERAPSSPTGFAPLALLSPGGEGRTALQLIRGEHGIKLFERIEAAFPPLYLYGAGHVGQALVRMLAGLPFSVIWIDSRAALLPADLPDNVTPLLVDSPLETIRSAPSGTRYLVMTHDHALDYALCRAILERGDFAYAGVIGSISKAARFRSRLARDGLSPEQIGRLVCPIGIAGIASKLPAAIAVAVLAQLLQNAAPRLSPALPQLAEADCSAEGCASCPQTHRRPR